MKISALFFSTLAGLTLCGCAMTYKPPAVASQSYSVNLGATQPELFAAAQRVLASDGYQITSANSSSGVISTAPRDLHVTPAQANCGTTMGINYLKDPRTRTRVAFNVVTGAGTLTVRANIQGEYKPGGMSATQNITLTCVSTGRLEHQLQQQIEAQVH